MAAVCFAVLGGAPLDARLRSHRARPTPRARAGDVQGVYKGYLSAHSVDCVVFLDFYARTHVLLLSRWGATSGGGDGEPTETPPFFLVPPTHARSRGGAVRGERACMPFEELAIQSDERDARLLAGGNFYGSELIAPPPLAPLPSDFIDEESAADATAATPPPLIVKLPGRQKG
jgi:hypothetical protein